MMELEICVDSVESAKAAEAGGARRVELCSALSEGGLTPSLGLIRAVRDAITIGLFVMIRPRSGDFSYSEDEFEVMQTDTSLAVQARADGVVFGLLTPEGDVDVPRTHHLVQEAGQLEVTFHRAIDMARDQSAALEDIVGCGAARILTSGSAPSAILGGARIGELVQAAEGRIGVMVCGGVRPANVSKIAQATGATQFHASLRKAVPSPVVHHNPRLSLGDAGHGEYKRYVLLAEDVRALRQAMAAEDQTAGLQEIEMTAGQTPDSLESSL
jgi:copper homeostasis protein